MKKQRTKPPFVLFLAISLALHVFAIGAWFYFSSVMELFRLNTLHSIREKQPLVFELEYEVVETPESARTLTPPEKTKYLSDKNARAQNEIAPESLPIDQPYAEGVVEQQEMSERPSARTSIQETILQSKESAGEKVVKFQDIKTKSFSRDFLTGSIENSPVPDGELYRPSPRNRQSRVPDMGGFSINTYEWDFAPYILRLKRRIERNIFPPPAFTYMGIISGQILLRFRILPDGSLDSLRVISYVGHKSLVNTSMKAVEASAPFEPLPDDFPERYLEVTGLFNYLNPRQ